MTNYSGEEKARAVDYLIALRKDLVRDFMRNYDLRLAGTKVELRSAIETAIADGSVRFSDIVEYLDVHEPWNKQHIYPLNGPEGEISQWRRPQFIRDLLSRHNLERTLNSHIAAILPRELRVVRFMHSLDHLRITAVARREGTYRSAEYDEEKELPNGLLLELRAYVREVVRNIVALDWDLAGNEAMLQIGQLPSGVSYEEVKQDFAKLLAPWLDLTRFRAVDLRSTIRHLHEREEAGSTETMSTAIDYETQGGRRFAARGGSSYTPLLGETVTDDALRRVRQVSSGRLGNVYWLPAPGNPIITRVHVYIISEHGRVNITMPQSEEVIRYVVGRIRAHAQQVSAAGS